MFRLPSVSIDRFIKSPPELGLLLNGNSANFANRWVYLVFL